MGAALIDVTSLQLRLAQHGINVGRADGIAGPRTWAGFLAHVSQRKPENLLEIGAGCAKHLARFGITDTAERLCNFAGQAAHETGRFHYLREIWGPTSAQARYEGRRDLGNTVAGDGKRFLGRGIFQLTGRANYTRAGAALGLDLAGQPELAERPDIAVLTACWFWDENDLSALADAGKEDAITRRINGGINGLPERRQLVARAKGLFS